MPLFPSKSRLQYWQARYLYADLKMLFFANVHRQAKATSDLALLTPTAEDFFRLTTGIPQIDGQQRLLRERFAAGDHACLIRQDNQVLHVSWWGVRTTLSPDYELGAGCEWPLPQPAPVIFDCWTAPSARGQNLYPKVLMQLSNRLLDNYPAVWIYCLDTNLPSRRGIEKAGFEYRGMLQRTRLLGKFLKCSRNSEN